MKIIHTSDWHLGKILNDYSLLEDQRCWLSSFIQILQDLKPDAVIIAGDIYDRSVPSAEAVSLLNETILEMIHRLQCAVIMIAGNHDSKERLCFGSELLEASQLYIIGTAQPFPKQITLSDSFGPVNFYPIPYLNRYDIKSALPDSTVSSLQQAFEEFTQPLLEQVNPNERNVLIAHGFFAPIAPEDITEEQRVGADSMISLLPFDLFDYIALGHIHMQKSAGLKQSFYSGSPLKYSIDEANQKKGILEITLNEKGSLQITPHEIPFLHDLKVITGSFAEVLSDAAKQSSLCEDYVFFSLTDTIPVPDAVTRLKVYYPNILGVKLAQIDSIFSSSGIDTNALQQQDTETLFKEFYEQFTDEPMTPYQHQLTHSILKDLEEPAL
jgi:exonuclease SbcD